LPGVAVSAAPVDVLALLQRLDARPRFKRLLDSGEQVGLDLDEWAEIRTAVAELIEALKAIAELDPREDSKAGFNEWGEAECFDKAQKIASAALKAVQP
jgi:hypothetical protein